MMRKKGPSAPKFELSLVYLVTCPPRWGSIALTVVSGGWLPGLGDQEPAAEGDSEGVKLSGCCVLAVGGAAAQRVLGPGEFAAEVGGMVQAADQASGEHAGVSVGGVVGFHDGGQQPVVVVVLDDQQAAGGVGVHDEVAGGIGDGRRGRAARWMGTACPPGGSGPGSRAAHRSAAARIALGSSVPMRSTTSTWVRKWAISSGVRLRSRGRRPGAATIRPVLSVPLVARASRLPPGWCPIRCSTSGPQTMTNRSRGLVIVLRTSRSMPRFSVVSVPVIATPAPAWAATAAARSLSPSVQTATGAR